MELEFDLTTHHLTVKGLPQVEQQGQCVAHLAIAQSNMKLEADSIWQATNGAIDILIVGIYEDGLAEVTATLKQRKPKFQTIAVDLVSHLSLADTHPDFQQRMQVETRIMAQSLMPNWSSEVILIRNDEAVVSGRLLAQSEGLHNDIVTCTLLCAAVQVGQRLENMGKTIILCSSNSDRFILPLKYPWR